MDIKPPFGYTDIAPLNRNQKVRLLAPGEVPAFARSLNAIPISYSEFALVAREYPIIFSTAGNNQSFAPIAVLGMAAGENLYNVKDKWASDVVRVSRG